MTKQQHTFMVEFAAVLTTLAEFSEPVPASSIYLALGMDWNKYERLARMLAQLGMVTRPSQSVIEITQKGRELAAQLNAALASA